FTTIAFKIRYATTKVEAWFIHIEGRIRFDPAAPERSSVRVVIDADSVDSRIRARDNFMMGPDAFDAEKYPKIVFESERVVPVGRDHFRVEGRLELNGAKKPVILDVHYLGEAKVQRWTQAAFSATGTLKRRDFGIGWNRRLENGSPLLGEEVELSFEIQATKQDGPGRHRRKRRANESQSPAAP